MPILVKFLYLHRQYCRTTKIYHNMRKIIIAPDSRIFEFRYDQLFEFHCRLFAILCGIPKKVTIVCDDSVGFDEVYKIEYA